MAVRSRRLGLYRTLVTNASLIGWVYDRYANEATGDGVFVD
jgi:hypothetical protein